AAGNQATAVVIGLCATSQSAKGKPANPRADCDALLARARQAMKEGKLDAANSFLTQAESLKVEYGVLHFGDTPKKLRAEMKQARRGAKQAAVRRPSEKFTPEAPQANAQRVAASAQPKATSARSTTPLEPGDEAPLPIPASGSQLQPLLPPGPPASP